MNGKPVVIEIVLISFFFLHPNFLISAPLLEQRIDLGLGILSTTAVTNISENNIGTHLTCAGLNGNTLLINGNSLYKLEDGVYNKYNADGILDSIGGGAPVLTRLSPDGEWLIFYVEIRFGEYLIKMYNIRSETIDRVFAGSGTSVLFNGPASKFVRLSAAYPNTFEIGEFTDSSPAFERVQVESRNIFDVEFFSWNGDRFFYSVLDDQRNLLWFSIDSASDGWVSSETGLRGKDPVIYDIADNGRLLLVTELDGGGEVNLAVYRDLNHKWIREEILFRYDVSDGLGNHFRMSENGNVVAVQSFSHTRGSYFLFNVFVFIKMRTNEWVRYKVNPPGVYALPNILLTDDGTKLFWLSYGESSVPLAEWYE